MVEALGWGKKLENAMLDTPFNLKGGTECWKTPDKLGHCWGDLGRFWVDFDVSGGKMGKNSKFNYKIFQLL